MPVIIMQTPVGRRAQLIDADAAEEMVNAGTATKYNSQIFEEVVTPVVHKHIEAEDPEEYQTKDMQPRRRGRSPKNHGEE